MIEGFEIGNTREYWLQKQLTLKTKIKPAPSHLF
jgi:hypothetical protein